MINRVCHLNLLPLIAGMTLFGKAQFLIVKLYSITISEKIAIAVCNANNSLENITFKARKENIDISFYLSY